MKRLFISIILICVVVIATSCSGKLPETNEYKCEFDTKNKTVSIVGYEGSSEKIVIPEKFGKYTVTEIGRNAFSKNYELSKITIPDTVTSIGDRAFELCIGLKEIELPPELKSIGNAAFSNCRSLRKISIPEAVEKIGLSVFTGCTSLEKIEVDENNSNYVSDRYGALLDKNQTTVIQYPTGSQRTKYEMPNTVTTIESYAFEKSKNLEEVTFSENLKTIKSYAFQASGIRSAEFSNRLEQIGNFAFNESKLSSITLGNSVKNIGDSAFAWCTSLTEIEIPSTTDVIGVSAFFMCTSIEKYTIGKENKKFASDDYGVLFNKDKSILLYYPVGSTTEEYTVPSTVKTISASSFSTCLNIKKIIIPDSVEEINDLAFSQCPSLTDVIYEGTKPESIAENAFEK